MKRIPRIFVCAALACSLIPSWDAAAQPEELFRKRLRQVKDQHNFGDWGPETGKVIPGVAISKRVLPQLGPLRKVWREDNYSVERVQKVRYAKIRKWWRLEKDRFESTMVVAPTFDAAKQYLILRYVNTQREPPLVRPAGRESGLTIGNVCFVATGDRGESFSSIDFIRHNVLFMMRAEGNVQRELGTMANILDALLLKMEPARKYEQLPELPRIEAFSPAKAKINLGQSVPLSLQVKNPRQRELRYLWTMTGGGIDKDLLENFVYYGGEKGKQRITVTVVNDLGLHDSKSTEIEVVQP